MLDAVVSKLQSFYLYASLIPLCQAQQSSVDVESGNLGSMPVSAFGFNIGFIFDPLYCKSPIHHSRVLMGRVVCWTCEGKIDLFKEC